jgi:hypothetical protein
MPINIVQGVTIATGFIKLKLSLTVDIDTLINNNFDLVIDGATPSPIVDPFETIDVLRDYDSISRTITLYYANSLVGNTDYILTISGLKTPYQEIIATSQITFTTPTDTTIDVTEQVPVSVPVIIEDVSIRDITAVDLTTAIVVSADKDLRVTSVAPTLDQAYYVSSSYNEGRIEVIFNAVIAANFVSSDYFKVQRKTVGRGMARWEDVTTIVTSDSTNGIVIIYMPSNDATPVYGEPDLTYWEVGYKYRLRISGTIGSATDTIYVADPQIDEHSCDFDGGMP